MAKSKSCEVLANSIYFILLPTYSLLEPNTFRKTLFLKILCLQNGREVTAPVTTHIPAYRVALLRDSCVSCYRPTAQLGGDVTTQSGFVRAHKHPRGNLGSRRATFSPCCVCIHSGEAPFVMFVQTIRQTRI